MFQLTQKVILIMTYKPLLVVDIDLTSESAPASPLIMAFDSNQFLVDSALQEDNFPLFFNPY